MDEYVNCYFGFPSFLWNECGTVASYINAIIVWKLNAIYINYNLLPN